MINAEIQETILREILALKKIIEEKCKAPAEDSTEELMDTADALKYLKISRRTLLSYRQLGLPSIRKGNGKVFFWKAQIDEFLGRNK